MIRFFWSSHPFALILPFIKPNVVVKTGMASVLWAITLLFQYNSDDQILRICFMYSFITIALFNTLWLMFSLIFT